MRGDCLSIDEIEIRLTVPWIIETWYVHKIYNFGVGFSLEQLDEQENYANILQSDLI